MKIIPAILFKVCLVVTGSHVMAQTNNPAPVPREADSLYFNMKYGEAASKYIDFIKQNPQATNVTLSRLAYCFHFTGKYNEAVKYYEKVLTNKPTVSLKGTLFSRMAMTYSMKKEKQKALIYLDSANANGYLNSYEMEAFKDFAFIRTEPKFKLIYEEVYKRAFPCKTRPHARDFDFWIGEWDVYLNSYPNHRVGSSVIQNVSGECTILENWQAFNNPFNGKSQNWYDTTTKKWTQLWIGAGGGYQYYTDGEYKDGAMRFKFNGPDANGVIQPGNFIFYNLGADKVRQYQELSIDSGKTFRVSYDFIYIRKKKQ
jgi:tetratricopeptide (TPR) repeat protein